MENSKHEFSGAYQYNASDNDLSADYFRSRMKYIRPYLRVGERILELGCGNGQLSEMMKKETGGEVYGIDISKSGVTLACRRGVLARIADLNKRLPYKNNYFDTIVSNQLLEHIYKTDHLLDEIYRVLKPGGICITITPNLSFWLNRILFVFGFYPIFLECSEKFKDYGMKSLIFLIKDKYAMGHVRIFNLSALEDIFQRHKFNIRTKKGLPLSWQLPSILNQIYRFVDRTFSLFPSLSRDILLVAEKR
jgi:ubiquinone/menaquinone biosynthesis C-methylase UbiE